MENEKIRNIYEAEAVKDLSVEAACAEVLFVKSLDGQIHVEAEETAKGKYFCGIKGEKLVVRYEVPKKLIALHSDPAARIRIFLPAELALEQIVMEIGAGSMKIQEAALSCRNMSVEVGAGKWEAQQLSVSEKFTMEIGAGKAEAKQVDAGMLNIECGVGDCTYEGAVRGDINVKCGVGNCKLNLDNKESDFSYDISCALGNVGVNGNKVKSIGTQKISAGEETLGKATLECGIGNIFVTTKIL